MIKWGIIGLGNMAKKFAASFNSQKDIFLTGIASNTNLDNFSKEFKIDKEFQFKSYSDLLGSSNIDAVYISTLNNTHFDLIEEAINYDKKILCEKPFVIKIEEANIINERIKNKKNFFLEAIAYRSHPITHKIIEFVNNDELGDIQQIHCSFGFKVKKFFKKPRFSNKDLGGGCILDLGCYPISFAELFRDKTIRLKNIETFGTFSSTNVDNHAEINYVMNDKILVKAKVSFKEDLSNDCIIYGSKKTMRIFLPWIPEKKSIIEIFEGENYFKQFVICEKDVFSNQLNLASKFFSQKYDDKDYELKHLVRFEQSYEIFKILDVWMKNLK